MADQAQANGSGGIEPHELMDERTANRVRACIHLEGHTTLRSYAKAEGHSYTAMSKALSGKRLPYPKYARVFNALIDKHLGQPA